VRVLIVCDFLFKYGSQQARSLAAAGHDVGMLCRAHALEFGGSQSERGAVVDSLRDHGVRVLVLPGRVRSLSAAPAMLRIRRALRAFAPQVVHVHENHDPRLLALTAGYPTVLTVHDPLGHPGAPALSRSENWAFRRWFRRADHYIVHGQALVPELTPIVGDKPITVVPHGVTARSEPFPPPLTPTILLFGRLEQYKGVDVLAAAMPLVWERRPDARLVVAGAGVAARLVPNDPRITLDPRYISEQEVDGLVASASLVALPYTQASQSGVGMLAIARGVPVVVSDLGALPELAYDTSFVSAAGDERSLADAILRHLDDGIEERDAVLHHAQEHFSWERSAQLTVAVYSDVLSASGS
jgi:glycosyltransferase involved in cell wall biosynthesis